MSNSTLIAVVAASAGVGYVLYKRSQKNVVAPADPCKKLCALVPDPTYRAECEAACNAAQLLGQVASAVSPFHDSTEQWSHEQKRRANINNRLNGGKADPSKTFDDAGAPPYTAPDGAIHILDRTLGQYGKPDWLNGGVFRYPNGCVPFFGAPGFSKCAPGTLDEYGMALDAATPDTDFYYSEKNFLAVPYFLTVEQYAAASDQSAMKNGDSASSSPPGAVRASKAAMMTGAYGDPSSTGPWADRDTGLAVWRVRGQLTAPAPKGLAPRAVLMGLANRTVASIAALSDVQALELIPALTDVSHDGVRTNYDCSNVPPNFTFDASINGWRRMSAGETQKLAPACTGAGGAPITKYSQSVIVTIGGRVIEHI